MKPLLELEQIQVVISAIILIIMKDIIQDKFNEYFFQAWA